MKSFPSRTSVACLSALLFSVTACASSGTSGAKPPAKRPVAAKTTAAPAGEGGQVADFTQWREVADFIDRMVAQHGFQRPPLEAMFRNARYVESAVRLMQPAPPGRARNW